MTDMCAIECTSCGRAVGAKGRAEASKMWNAALDNKEPVR
jgi:hypothetical protein